MTRLENILVQYAHLKVEEIPEIHSSTKFYAFSIYALCNAQLTIPINDILPTTTGATWDWELKIWDAGKRGGRRKIDKKANPYNCLVYVHGREKNIEHYQIIKHILGLQPPVQTFG